jgi:hypothetical protein
MSKIHNFRILALTGELIELNSYVLKYSTNDMNRSYQDFSTIFELKDFKCCTV